MTAELVCQRAGLSKRYFYAEFDARDDVLDACAEELFTRLAGVMAGAMEGGLRPERIRSTVESVVHTLAADPASARLYAECPAVPALRERQQRAVEEFSRRMAEDAMPFGGTPVPGVRRDLATRMLVAGATELITAWLQGAVEATEESIIATISATALAAGPGL